MTVAELIEVLKKEPQEARVCIRTAIHNKPIANTVVTVGSAFRNRRTHMIENITDKFSQELVVFFWDH